MMGRGNDFGADYVGPLLFLRQWEGGMGAHVGESDNLYNLSHLTNSAKYTTSHINGLVLGGVYAFSNQASRTGGAGFANDRACTFGVRYQNGPLVAAASYLEVNQPTAGNTEGNNQSGAGAGVYVNLRNIFSGPVIRQQAVAGGANYTRGSLTAGLLNRWVKLSCADRTSLRLSNHEANGRYRFAGEWKACVALIYTDGYADGANSLDKFAVGNRPKWEKINRGLDYTLSKRTSLYGLFVWQKATVDVTQAAIFNSGPLSGRRTAVNSAPHLKCAHDSSRRLPLHQRSAEVIDRNNSLGVLGAWDIKT
jgi:general bacterial porin, GBP family